MMARFCIRKPNRVEKPPTHGNPGHRKNPRGRNESTNPSRWTRPQDCRLIHKALEGDKVDFECQVGPEGVGLVGYEV